MSSPAFPDVEPTTEELVEIELAEPSSNGHSNGSTPVSAEVVPLDVPTCPICGEPVPPERLKTGAKTCAREQCQKERKRRRDASTKERAKVRAPAVAAGLPPLALPTEPLEALGPWLQRDAEISDRHHPRHWVRRSSTPVRKGDSSMPVRNWSAQRYGGRLAPSPVPLSPHLRGVYPSRGPDAGGTPLTVLGTNLTDTVRLYWDNSDVAFTVVSDSALSAVSPPGVAGTSVPVFVTDLYGQRSNTLLNGFTYVGLVPPGTPLAERGVAALPGYWEPAGSRPPASLDEAQGTTRPGGPIEAVPITAWAPNEHLFLADGVTAATWDSVKWVYWPIPPAPNIISITPDVGPAAGGQSVVIMGTDFAPATARAGSNVCRIDDIERDQPQHHLAHRAARRDAAGPTLRRCRPCPGAYLSLGQDGHVGAVVYLPSPAAAQPGGMDTPGRQARPAGPRTSCPAPASPVWSRCTVRTGPYGEYRDVTSSACCPTPRSRSCCLAARGRVSAATIKGWAAWSPATTARPTPWTTWPIACSIACTSASPPPRPTPARPAITGPWVRSAG